MVRKPNPGATAGLKAKERGGTSHASASPVPSRLFKAQKALGTQTQALSWSLCILPLSTPWGSAIPFGYSLCSKAFSARTLPQVPEKHRTECSQTRNQHSGHGGTVAVPVSLGDLVPMGTGGLSHQLQNRSTHGHLQLVSMRHEHLAGSLELALAGRL